MTNYGDQRLTMAFTNNSWASQNWSSLIMNWMRKTYDKRKEREKKNDFAWIQIYNWSMAEFTLQPFNHRNLTAHFSLKCLIKLLHSINLLNWVGKEASSTVANQNGYKRDREARECKAHKNRSRWEKLTGVTILIQWRSERNYTERTDTEEQEK